MQILLFSLGLIVFLAVALDILQTTLSLQGGGWLTTRFCSGAWSLVLKVAGRDGTSKILVHTGYVLLISVAFVWVILLWVSYVLILSSTEGSVVNGTTKLPAEFWEKVYYAGFTLSTLGVGDYTAPSDFWRFITTLYSFSGLIFLTMSVTYLIPALSAVMEQRKLGINISSYGTNAQDIIINSWNGNDFGRLLSQTPNMSDTLIIHSQHHRAYPVIQYFHNPDKNTAVILQMARLHEALYIMRHFLREDLRPSEAELSNLTVAYKVYVEVIKDVTSTSVMEDVEPEIHLDKLKKKGMVLPGMEPSNLEDKFKSDRKVFFTLVYRNGWRWQDIYQSSEDYHPN